jgi:tartrate-resistant acid phosphatase type 5
MHSDQVSRRTVLLGATGGALLPLAPAVARAPSLNFVVVGDWGREGTDKQREVAQAMGRRAEAIGSRFVISVGDNFYENGVAGISDKQWKTSFEDIYTAPSLQTPWHAILGNHDYRGDVPAQIAYTRHSSRWNMPARYYQRQEKLADGTSVDLFYIDTSPFIAQYRHTKVRIDDQDTAAQLRWFDAALGASTARWKLVIGHHPIHTVTGGDRDEQDMIHQFKPLLRKHGVHAYINGHVHNLQYLQHDGIHYVTCGAGSRVYDPGPAKPGQFASGHHGFMTAELSADRLAFSLIDDSGTALYAGQVAG